MLRAPSMRAGPGRSLGRSMRDLRFPLSISGVTGASVASIADNGLLLEDNVSFLLLEDNASVLLKEAA